MVEDRRCAEERRVAQLQARALRQEAVQRAQAARTVQSASRGRLARQQRDFRRQMAQQQREMGLADVADEGSRAAVDPEQAEMHANAAALAAGQVQAHHLHSVIHHAQEAQQHMDGPVLEAPVHHENTMMI